MSETSNSPDSGHFSIDPLTRVSSVTLAVRDMDGMAHFYTDVVGFTVCAHSQGTISLGIGTTPIIRLKAGAVQRPPTSASGLFHVAILLPTRSHLGQWLEHLTRRRYPLDGAGDHLVSEAVYLSDPEGNGIEMYCDRPREVWEYTRHGIMMDTLPVDLEALRGDALEGHFSGLPQGTTLGHIHLKVDDVSRAIDFYRDILGFELTATFPGAGFLSAGGYHHHIGVNSWRSRNAPPAPRDSSGLVSFTITLPSEAARRSVVKRLDAVGCVVDTSSVGPILQDPAGNRIEISVEQSGSRQNQG